MTAPALSLVGDAPPLPPLDLIARQLNRLRDSDLAALWSHGPAIAPNPAALANDECGAMWLSVRLLESIEQNAWGTAAIESQGAFWLGVVSFAGMTRMSRTPTLARFLVLFPAGEPVPLDKAELAEFMDTQCGCLPLPDSALASFSLPLAMADVYAGGAA